MLKRTAVLIYGVVSYLIFLGTFLYMIAFVGDLAPKSMNSGAQAPLTTGLLIDAILLSVFALQHSIMARPWFKRAWTNVIPAAAERSTYVLFSSLALMLLVWQWRPLGGSVWKIYNDSVSLLITSLGLLGWLMVLVSTFLIDHFDLFGLRQAFIFFRGGTYTVPAFRQPLLYRVVRHPIYLGFLIAFWSTPAMTPTRLVFALACTGYILVGIQLEERDLVRIHGESYRRYREQVPMILPIRGPSGSESLHASEATGSK
jgi:protein-S-isoprenylcysteine O-methyltransferase Ste14